MHDKDSKTAIDFGMQALAICLQSDFPGVHNELAQLYHNLSHLHMITDNKAEAG